MLKDLTTYKRDEIEIQCPISDSELNEIKADPEKLNEYLSKLVRKKDIFRPVGLRYNGQNYSIQANMCTNPFCAWFGCKQESLHGNNKTPRRYKIGKGKNKYQRSLFCNPYASTHIETGSSIVLSNWALSKEIERLIEVNNLKKNLVQYKFHRQWCPNENLNPFDNPSDFYKRGKSTSNSQKWQCKSCKKITNTLPDRKKSFTYNHRIENINKDIFNQIIGKQPIRKKLSELGIGSSTYYYRLKYIYERCLEFLERHERDLKTIEFDTLWLQSDVFNYTLRNQRKYGNGKGQSPEKYIMKTAAIGTADRKSKYLFRLDLAYDYEMTASSLAANFKKYMEYDFLEYSRKSAHYRIGNYGDPSADYSPFGEKNINTLLRTRTSYIDGFHTKMSYTAFAHYWLLQQDLNIRIINITTDNDSSLKNAIHSVYNNEIKNKKLNHILQLIDKEASEKDSLSDYFSKQRFIKKLISEGAYKNQTEASKDIIRTEILTNGTFKQTKNKDGKFKTKPIPIEHPIPRRDQPYKRISIVTPVDHMEIEDCVDLFQYGDLGVIDTIFQFLRRNSFLVERPLVGSKKSSVFIYTNINPKYAHYIFVILRTYYNFIKTQKIFGVKKTPAMQLGLADKAYDIEDILYIK